MTKDLSLSSIDPSPSQDSLDLNRGSERWVIRRHREYRYCEMLRNFERQFGSYHRNAETWSRTQAAEAELAKADEEEMKKG